MNERGDLRRIRGGRSLSTSFLFKNMSDTGKFSDYKWPRTSPVEKIMSTPHDISENLILSSLKNANSLL